MSAEQFSEELLRLNADEALHTYADILHLRQGGDSVDDVAEFRAHTVAVIACSALVQVDESGRARELFIDGLVRYGLRPQAENITAARWRGDLRVAYKSLRVSNTFNPDEKEIVSALLTHDPRVTIVTPQAKQI